MIATVTSPEFTPRPADHDTDEGVDCDGDLHNNYTTHVTLTNAAHDQEPIQYAEMMRSQMRAAAPKAREAREIAAAPLQVADDAASPREEQSASAGVQAVEAMQGIDNGTANGHIDTEPAKGPTLGETVMEAVKNSGRVSGISLSIWTDND
jgi:hypothetical protein